MAEESMEQRVAALESDVAVLRARVGRAETEASSANTLARAVDRDVAEIRDTLRAHTRSLQALRETQVEQGARLDAIEALLANVVTLLGDLDRRVTRLEARFDGLEGRFDGLEGRFDGLGGRFDGLEGRFDGLVGRFDGLEGRFDGLAGEFGALAGRFDGLEQRMERQEIRLGALEQGMGRGFDEIRTEMRDGFGRIMELLEQRP